jgi:hypothetical protein
MFEIGIQSDQVISQEELPDVWYTITHRDMQAIAQVCTRLGQYSLEYGKDFAIKTCGGGAIVLQSTMDHTSILKHLKWI